MCDNNGKTNGADASLARQFEDFNMKDRDMYQKSMCTPFAFFKLLMFLFIFTASPLLQGAVSDPVSVELLHENTSVKPGHPFWVAIHIKMEDKWHCYWKNPGDIGMPIAIDWSLPEGFEASIVEWPVPKRFDHDSIVGYGYEDEVILLSKITPPAQGINLPAVRLGASLSWLACSESECLPGSADVALDVPVHNAPPKTHEAWGPLIAKARENLPKSDWTEITAKRNADLLEIALKAPACLGEASRVLFFPETQNHIDDHIEATVTYTNNLAGLYVVGLKENEAQKSKLDTIKGILVLQGGVDDQILHAIKVDLPISDSVGGVSPLDSSELAENDAFSGPTQSIAPHPDAQLNEGILFYMASAFLGGLILNLMPCVLPVISLKIMSFVNMSGKDRSKTFKHGLAFSLGVLISFWFLAAILLALQLYGHAVGWGFQMQDPKFIAVFAIIMLVFSLSMFGVLEVGTLFASWAGQGEAKAKEGSDTLYNSFFSGVFATAVATPCTGPFLGPAVAFAVLQPPYWALLVFTALGIGMASPYLLLSAFPEWLKFIPRPGNWMITFKECAGFMMMACVIWLLWVFSDQTSSSASFLLLAGLFAISFGCWIYGKWASPIRVKRVRMTGLVIGLIFFIIGGKIAFYASTLEAPLQKEGSFDQASAGSSVNSWEPFNEARLHALQLQGIPVIIDFTARWCLICQANHFILATDSVENKMRDLGVVKMKADWTRYDPAITNELRKHGRNSVPLYLLYPGKPGVMPEVLPQVLTPDTVIKYLDEL